MRDMASAWRAITGTRKSIHSAAVSSSRSGTISSHLGRWRRWHQRWRTAKCPAPKSAVIELMLDALLFSAWRRLIWLPHFLRNRRTMLVDPGRCLVSSSNRRLHQKEPHLAAVDETCQPVCTQDRVAPFEATRGDHRIVRLQDRVLGKLLIRGADQVPGRVRDLADERSGDRHGWLQRG